MVLWLASAIHHDTRGCRFRVRVGAGPKADTRSAGIKLGINLSVSERNSEEDSVPEDA